MMTLLISSWHCCKLGDAKLNQSVLRPAGRHVMSYDDGDSETVSLSNERVDWSPLAAASQPTPGELTKPEPSALAAEAAAAAAAGGYTQPQPAQGQQQEQSQQGQAEAGSAAAPAEPEAGQQAHRAKPREPKASVEVICNDLTGIFSVASMQITLPNGTSMSPTEFERQAGKAASKKWKASIRVHKVRSLCLPCCRKR